MVSFGLVTLLAACGELPKPFAQTSVLNNNPLIILDGGGAVKVEMDPALPMSLSKPLSDNMVESLWEESVPASTAAGFSPRYFLRGKLKILNSSLFEAEEAEIIWVLTEVNNKKIHEFRYKLSGDHPGWLLLDKNPLDNLPVNMGKDVVRQLYKQQELNTPMLNLTLNKDPPVFRNKLNLGGNTLVQQLNKQQGLNAPMLNLALNKDPSVLRNQLKLPENALVQQAVVSNDSLILQKKPKIFLAKVVGAPGDGNNSLYKNMRRMLIIAGANMVKERQRSDFLLNGFVNVSPGYDTLPNIAITWLITTKDGRIVGKTTQNKRSAEDTVSQEWRQEAVDAAVDGSVSIMSIITGYLVSSRD